MKEIKRKLAAILAFAMIFSLAIPAYAAAKGYERPETTKAGAEKVTGTWSKDAQGNWTFSPNGGGNVGKGWFLLNSSNSSTEYKWYCFDEKSTLRTGWINDTKDPSIWYYAGETTGASEGSLMTGWVTDPRDGKKYYMDPATGIMSYGWKQLDGVWYYFGEKQYANATHPYGSMYVSEKTPDGYYVNSNGAWGQTTSSGGSSGGSYTPKPTPTPTPTPTPIPEPVKYSVSFDMQGHGEQIDDQLVEKGGKVVKPEAPKATGYVFSDWYKEAGCINKWVFNSDVVNTDTTLFANWQGKKTRITFDNDSGIDGPDSVIAVYGEAMPLIRSTPSKASYVFSGYFDDEGKQYYNSDGSSHQEWDKEDETTKLTAHYDTDPACLAAGTMITMADGTRKPVEALSVGDMIKAFDHTAGKLTDAKIIDYWHYPEPKSGLMTLHFTNDINIGIVTAHSFFCIEDNTYVYIDEKNVEEYIGKHFYNAETGASEELLSVTSSDEKVETFYLATEEHFNCVAEGLLNLEDGIYLAVYSCFEYDENKVINRNKLAEDIKKYGLFTYEDFSYMTEEEFINHKLEYLKIVLGKGIISESDLQLLKTLYFSDEYNIDIQ